MDRQRAQCVAGAIRWMIHRIGDRNALVFPQNCMTSFPFLTYALLYAKWHKEVLGGTVAPDPTPQLQDNDIVHTSISNRRVH